MTTSISVIGLGKLGLCTAACLAKAGYKVLGVDIREDYITELANSKVPFHEKGLPKLLKETRQNISFTTSTAKAVEQSTATFVIVPTPSDLDGAFSNDYLFEVLKDIGPTLAEINHFHVVNIVSTVMPNSCQDTFIPLLEKLSGKKAGDDFGVAYNPEFIAIGSVIENFLNPDLVLIGASDSRTGDQLEDIYTKICTNAPYMARTSLVNAEITKLALNCYCTMKISFANNIATICDTIPNADAGKICEIIGQDSRVGTKYIKPGLGFGGPCFPRDNEAFIRFIEQNKGVPDLQQAVVKINNTQPQRFAEKIAQAAEKYGSQIALLGLAYKPNTYLTERSQALDIANYLAANYPQLQLKVYDPLARQKGPWEQTATLEDCVTEANVAVILTPWDDFLASDWHSFLNTKSIIIDFWK